MWAWAAILALGGGLWWVRHRPTSYLTTSPRPAPVPQYTGPQLSFFGQLGTQSVEVSRMGNNWAWYAGNGSGAEATRGEAFEVLFANALPNSPSDAGLQLTFGTNAADERIGLDVVPSQNGYAWTTKALRPGESFQGASGWAAKRGVAIREAYDSIEKEGY